MSGMYDRQKRAIILVALVLALGGILGWQQMPKEEDPRFPNRFASVTVVFPGGDAESIERLIVRPLERELREIGEIDTLEATASNDVAVLIISLEETIYDTQPIWDEVERSVDRAQDEFPRGVSSVELDWETTDLESVTYVITGSDSWLQLKGAAEKLEERLLTVEGVKRVVHTPDLETQLTIALHQESAAALAISPRMVAALIEARSAPIPGGSLRLGSREVTVDSASSFASLEEISATAIPAGNTLLPLSSVAEVTLGPEEPVREMVRFNGESAHIVGVVPEQKIDLIDFGARLRKEIGEVEREIAPLSVGELTFQPDRVSTRLDGLQFALLQGILIVAGIAVVAMGVRVGGVVALSVPAVALAALLFYTVAGGVLHQMSVAALVVSLGLLVDNAIVVSERIQWRLDRGEERSRATVQAVRELALPLAAATGTTLAAFLPLLLSRGTSADFTRAIPQVVMLTVGLSFFYSITVVPTMGGMVFRPQTAAAGKADALLSRLAASVTRRPGLILAAASLLLLFSISLLPRIQLQFFPGADRNQLVLELELPTGTHLETTAAAVAEIEEAMLGLEDVLHVASFIGRPTPSFYYNLVGQGASPNFAQLLVTTRSEQDVSALARHGREAAAARLPGVTFVARPLEQGPPAQAPVAVRLYSEDREALATGVRAVFQQLRSTSGTRDVRHDLDLGTVAYVLSPQEAALISRGSSIPGAAEALLARTRGLPAGEFRGSDEPVTIVVRSPDGSRTPIEALDNTLLTSADGAFPLAGAALGELEIRPATIRRENRRQLATVFSELEEGTGYNEVVDTLLPRIDSLLPPGVEWELGGAAESSQEANTAIAEASYAGVAILLFILLLQFRSFIRVGLILLTIPLATVGVIPGLVIFREPFGFMSLLGAFSLIGIVVNNAIILIDTIDSKRTEGEELSTAVQESVTERFRPIVLTVLTTVSGLAPLLFSSSSLWPPFASAMISGLLASTVMTLMVVPAAYYLIYRRRDSSPRRLSRVAPALLGIALFALLLPAPAAAESRGPRTPASGAPVPEAAAPEDAAPRGVSQISLAEAVTRAAAQPVVDAFEAEAAAQGRALRATRREAWLPALSLEGSYLRRSDEMAVSFGPVIGDVTQIPDEERRMVLTIEQPLLSLPAQEGAISAERELLNSANAAAEGALAAAQLDALLAYLLVEELSARREAATTSREALSTQYERVARLVEVGRLLRSDRLRLEVELRSLDQRIGELDRGLEIAMRDLARLTGSGSPLGTVPLALSQERMRQWLAGVPESVAGRPQLEALAARQRSVAARRRAVTEGFVPELRLRISGVREFETELDPQQWIEGELTLSWAPVARGVRLARRTELLMRERSIKQRLEQALSGGAIELDSLRNALLSALEREAVAEQNVRQREILLEEALERYEAGRIPLSQFVDAEAELAEARVERRVARLEAVEAAARLTQLTGLQLESELSGWLQ